MSQQYSLRWNNHQPNFISMFGTLLATKNLVDVTLAAEGQHLAAHKVVLSACSTYFHSLFVDNPSPHPIVILKDIKINDLKTMVDFMYYGEVNVTEEQLPQVLETAKVLKIKGLTEMPDSTSLTRSQGSLTDFQTTDTSNETVRPLSPISPSLKRRKRRLSSTGSGVNRDNRITDDNMSNDCGQRLETIHEAVTLSSVPQQKRRELDERLDVAQQTAESSNLNIDQLSLDTNSAVGLAQDIPSNVQLRRGKFFKRQSRVKSEETQQPRKRSTESPRSLLRKYESYPQYLSWKSAKRSRNARQLVGSVYVTSVEPITTATMTATTSSCNSIVPEVYAPHGPAHRASHTPAVRSGPPLSCNYCWNTVDKCGRILRRKTQYHCPECRTNLCIVPCFHQYHDDPEAMASAAAAAAASTRASASAR